MRQKIKVSDLTTLFVCPSAEWGTLERRAIADSVYFRDIGGNSIIFCLKGSYIDIEAQRQDISIIYYTGKRVNPFFDLSYLLDMRKILQENRFNIIHCYSLDYVWKLSFLLMANSKVPLFLTLNSLLAQTNKNILQRWLFRRVDHVITFCKVTSELVYQYLPVSLHKVKVTGGGIETIKKNHKKDKTNTRKIGAFINLGTKYYKEIETLLYAIAPLNQAIQDLSLKLEFYFYSENDWKTMQRFSEVMQKVQALSLGEYVFFHQSTNREHDIQSLDIFVGTSFSEPYNDFEIIALLSNIPTVLPRTAFRKQVLSLSRHIGESYLKYDSRELKDKILKILLNDQIYKSEILENYETLLNEHGIDSYSERITKLYELNFTKRLRVSAKLKKNSNDQA